MPPQGVPNRPREGLAAGPERAARGFYSCFTHRRTCRWPINRRTLRLSSRSPPDWQSVRHLPNRPNRNRLNSIAPRPARRPDPSLTEPKAAYRCAVECLAGWTLLYGLDVRYICRSAVAGAASPSDGSNLSGGLFLCVAVHGALGGLSGGLPAPGVLGARAVTVGANLEAFSQRTKFRLGAWLGA